MIKTVEFTLFDGELVLNQPKEGYRVAIDPVLLAASVPKENFNNAKILDMGCGIGTIGFCLLARFKAQITGVDIQEELIKVAKENAKQSGKIDFICADISKYKAEQKYDAVVMNPPYMDSGTLAENPSKRLANAETDDVKFIDWAKAAARNLDNGGHIFLIHRADRMNDVLDSLKDAGFGSFSVFPLWPREGELTKRIIISARKQKYAPLRLLSGLVLHDNNGYTNEAENILLNKGEISL